MSIKELNKRARESKGHFCYGCNEYFHDINPNVTEHKRCKGQKSLGICVDSIEFGKFHRYNLEDMPKSELVNIIQILAKDSNITDRGYIVFNKLFKPDVNCWTIGKKYKILNIRDRYGELKYQIRTDNGKIRWVNSSSRRIMKIST